MAQGLPSRGLDGPAHHSRQCFFAASARFLHCPKHIWLTRRRDNGNGLRDPDPQRIATIVSAACYCLADLEARIAKAVPLSPWVCCHTDEGSRTPKPDQEFPQVAPVTNAVYAPS